MKTIICLLLFTGMLGISSIAQPPAPKVVVLPASVANWGGDDSDVLLNDPVIRTRLKDLLGPKSYASFMESFETIGPIKRDGNILFSSGCLIHACTHLESAIAIDLGSNTIHAAIYNDEKRTRYFNERGSKTPRPISDWANRLKGLKNR